MIPPRCSSKSCSNSRKAVSDKERARQCRGAQITALGKSQGDEVNRDWFEGREEAGATVKSTASS
jgi:hypothetical protein